MNQHRTISVAEAAAALNVTTRAVYLLIARGQIDVIQIGRRYRIPETALDALPRRVVSEAPARLRGADVDAQFVQPGQTFRF